MKKRLLSILLALTLVIGFIPVNQANAALTAIEFVNTADGGVGIKGTLGSASDNIRLTVVKKAVLDAYKADAGSDYAYVGTDDAAANLSGTVYNDEAIAAGDGSVGENVFKVPGLGGTKDANLELVAWGYDDTSSAAGAVQTTITLDANGKVPVDQSTLVFDVKGGTLAAGANASVSVDAGSTVTLSEKAPSVSKTGYTLTGWSETDGGTAATTVTAAAKDGTKTVYAIWTANELSMNNISNITATYGDTANITLPTASNGTGTYTYALTGTLPTGLTESSGVISGTYGAAAAATTLTWTATDTGSAKTVSKNFTITVNKADQAAPTVSKTDVTAAGANDGTITITGFASGKFEYQAPGASTWTEAAAATIDNLVPGTYKVRLKGDANHNDGAAAEVTIAEPGAPVATITDLAKTYTGKPQKATVVVKIDGVEQDAADYEVVYTDKDGNTVADPTNAGNYTVTVTMNSKTAGTDTLVIAQAKPGEPELLDEIIVDETTLGDVMKNGALKLPGVNNDEVAGTFTWVGDVDDDTMIVPGTKYQWKFETTNPNYQGLVGEIAWELVNDEHAAYMFGTNAAKTTFEPTRGMTRAEVAVMIANLEEYDKDEDYEAELTKVPQDLKAEKANLEKWTDNGYNKICYILSEGIMQGRSDGNFDPYGTITRQEMAIVLGKYLGIAKYDGANLFNDLDKTAVYAEGKAYINALKDTKKIDGFPDGGYHPTENLTRAQAAKMMNYAMDRVPDIAKMKAANVESSFVDVQKFVGIADADWAVYNIIEASVTHAVSEYH